jgi:hypothetical protein
MTTKPIPQWATKPGTTVLFEAGRSYQDRVFAEAVITRVTKASVFVKVGTSDRERRFVPSSWNNDADRMWEYGQRDSWSPAAFIWNPRADHVIKTMEYNRVQALKDAVAKAATNLAEEMNGRVRSGEHIPSAIAELRLALDAYEAGK